jgi:hypothetical protein
MASIPVFCGLEVTDRFREAPALSVESNALNLTQRGSHTPSCHRAKKADVLIFFRLLPRLIRAETESRRLPGSSLKYYDAALFTRSSSALKWKYLLRSEARSRDVPAGKTREGEEG